MFFPISDDNPSSSTPYVTYLLIGLCSFVFILQYLSQMNPSIFYNFGFIPADFFSNYSSFTIYTSMFLHGGFFHIAGNMLYLWIFGDNVEDSMGTVKFIIFYLLCGTIAALCQGLVDPISQIPMVIKNRTEGVSKMLVQHMIKSVFNMFFLFLKVKLGLFK